MSAPEVAEVAEAVERDMEQQQQRLSKSNTIPRAKAGNGDSNNNGSSFVTPGRQPRPPAKFDRRPRVLLASIDKFEAPLPAHIFP